ncbi:hypothetical protein ACS0TY_027318 [Phlomoides rotata]
MRILIKTLAGENFSLEVESFDTIGCVKELIREKVGSHRPFHRLFWDGISLQDSRTIGDYDIQNDDTIDMFYPMDGGNHVRIKTFHVKTFSVMAKPSDTINVVKGRIQEQTGIPVNGQRLLFSGKELDNDPTLEDYSIGYGATLCLVRLRGDGDVVLCKHIGRQHFLKVMELGMKLRLI